MGFDNLVDAELSEGGVECVGVDLECLHRILDAGRHYFALQLLCRCQYVRVPWLRPGEQQVPCDVIDRRL